MPQAIGITIIPDCSLPRYSLARSALTLARAIAARLHPDAPLLSTAKEFHRLDAALRAATGEEALDAAWEARQRVADRLAAMRPASDAGRRAKAAVGVALLLEVAEWQRDSEWQFAVAAFRAEARG